jgi:aspartyl-tRNA(Asn)/glutamyl-tRNA(Gln) amidotransferase subunit A
MNEPKFSRLSAVQAAIEQGRLTCVELVIHYLSRIEAQKELNIYVEVFAEEALARARTLDERYRRDPSSLGRLYGMVVSIKDVICYKGHKVTAGSRMLEGFESLFSATAVERLLAEDAVIIGRTNCDEFAMGSTNETSVYGPTRNPIDPARIPGGSSGGAAAAVRADTCLAALGSDTGGSVRQPAAFCGVIGLKPTYGRISRHGLLAYGSSFDQIGVLAHSVDDAALLLDVMAGPDDHDATAAPAPAGQAPAAPPWPARVAYLREAAEHPSLDPATRDIFHSFILKLRQQGHTVEAVDFPYLDYIIPAYYVLTTAEASSNLARYDGMRYGYRASGAEDLLDTYRRSRSEGFGREVKRRILLGAFVLSAGYYDAYYSKAQQVRRLIQQATFEIFRRHDFLLSPAAPSVAWHLGESLDDPVAMYLADIFTVQANMAGIPAIAFPAGEDPANGMPAGLQLMADRFAEEALLTFVRRLLDRPVSNRDSRR